MTKVFIPNKGGHDYSDAERFGELVFLTEGTVRKEAVNEHYRRMIEMGIGNSEPGDYLVVCSLSVLTAIAASILSRMHGKVNFLLFDGRRYVQRTVAVDNLL